MIYDLSLGRLYMAGLPSWKIEILGVKKSVGKRDERLCKRREYPDQRASCRL